MGADKVKAAAVAAGAGAGATPPVKVTPWDSASMKRALDDTILASLHTHAPTDESLTYGNVKLVIMAVSCVSAAVAQFYPLPYPDNRLLLGACAALYFFLSGVLQAMTSFFDGDIIYVSRKFKGKGSASASAAATAAGGKVQLVLRSSMPRGDDVYTLIAECPSGNEVARLSRSVGAFFTKAGELAESVVDEEVRTVLVPKLLAVGVEAGKGD